MIIDAHAHAFPDKIAAGALQTLTANARQYFHLYGEAHPHTDATTAGLTASSRAAGIDVSLVLPIATSPKPSHTINDFAAAVDRMPGLRSFGSVHPLNPEAEAEVARVRELGLKGIKLHPEYQECFVDEPETVAVVKAAAKEGLWVIFHAGADIGKPPPFHCTPERVCRLRQAVPEARIILAHMGGYRLWDEVLPRLSQMDVVLDTSYCLPNHPDQHSLFAQLIRLNGTGRVLFGTDSPWAHQGETLRTTRAFLNAYRFTLPEQQAILGGNAARILGEVPA